MISNSADLRQTVLDTLECVKLGTVNAKVGSSIARLANVALQTAIAEAQFSNHKVDFFEKPK